MGGTRNKLFTPCVTCAVETSLRWYKYQTGYICHKCYCSNQYGKKHNKINLQRRNKYDTDEEYRLLVLNRNSGWRVDNPSYRSEYWEQNKETESELQRQWRENNRPYNIQRLKEFRKKNPDYFKDYHKKNKWRGAMRAAIRRTRLLRACPKWTSLTAIANFYKNCPAGYHVDHTIPLKHHLVCGLHVIENLQYLPAEENLHKGTSFDGSLENNGWRLK